MTLLLIYKQKKSYLKIFTKLEDNALHYQSTIHFSNDHFKSSVVGSDLMSKYLGGCELELPLHWLVSTAAP